MKTMLVPLDGSALAEQVLPYVRMLAPVLEMQVRLFQVVPDWELGGTAIYSVAGMTMLPQEFDRPSLDQLRRYAEEYLAEQAAPLRAAGLDVATEVGFGSPAELIVEAAAEPSTALIALVTHGYSGLKRWALGSVTDKVAHAATTPVFIVRGVGQPMAEAHPITRILLPLDGSGLARQALPLATEMAIRTRAELFPLTVAVPPIGLAPEQFGLYSQQTEVEESLRARLVDEMGDSVETLKQQQVPITPVVANGFAAETIVDEAMRQRVDLIIMATHGRSGLKRWALGSVADKVLHATTVPLILVRAEEHAA